MANDRGMVLITGASRGLGAAVAEELSRLGHPVALCARGGDELDRVAGRIREAGGRCLARAVDVTDAPAVGRWIDDAASELGPPRVLINNASVLGPRSPLGDYPLDEWRGAIDVNLNGVFIASRLTVPRMLEEGRGSIVNVSSGAAIPPRERWGAYAVSKAAVEVLTLNLAKELEGTGVRVNSVDPGAMRTPMRAAAYPEEDPLRLKTPEETTGVFAWLAGDASQGVTGRRLSAERWRADAGLPAGAGEEPRR